MRLGRREGERRVFVGLCLARFRVQDSERRRVDVSKDHLVRVGLQILELALTRTEYRYVHSLHKMNLQV